MRSGFVVAVLMALSLTAVSAADNWPQFQPFAGVVADDPRLPDTWGTKENVAWKVAVPGLGWGSPIVWGEHAFVTSVLGDDTLPKPGLVIVTSTLRSYNKVLDRWELVGRVIAHVPRVPISRTRTYTNPRIRTGHDSLSSDT